MRSRGFVPLCVRFLWQKCVVARVLCVQSTTTKLFVEFGFALAFVGSFFQQSCSSAQQRVCVRACVRAHAFAHPSVRLLVVRCIGSTTATMMHCSILVVSRRLCAQPIHAWPRSTAARFLSGVSRKNGHRWPQRTPPPPPPRQQQFPLQQPRACPTDVPRWFSASSWTANNRNSRVRAAVRGTLFAAGLCVGVAGIATAVQLLHLDDYPPPQAYQRLE